MRVLRVAHHGVVSAWRQRERQLIDLDVDLTLVSARRWNEGGREVDLDASEDVFVRPAPTVGRHPNVFLYDPRVLWRLLSQRWDLVDLHEEPCSLAVAEFRLLRRLRRRRPPYVLYSAQNIEKRYPIPFRWFERRALEGAAGAYVCNNEAGEILARKGLSRPARFIGLGVDVSRFAPRERAAPTEDLAIGYVGRLESHKGVTTLIEAAAKNPTWHLWIVGDGPQRQELISDVGRLGISERVSFVGHLSDDDLADAYRSFDLVVVPSLPTPGWLEQFCRVAVEAMASGAVVVASQSGAIPDVVADAAVLFEPGDPAALEVAVLQAAEPTRWQSLRAAGFARASEFAWPAVAVQQRDFYEKCLLPVTRPKPSPPHVVVVAYGSPDLLAGSLDALGGAFDVIVVDNSSLAKTRAVAARHHATYLDPGSNVGFGAGVNMALAHLEAQHVSMRDVLLLNPDARISAPDVMVLQESLHEDEETACVAPAQFHPDTGVPERVTWPFPTPATAAFGAIGLGRFDQRRGFLIGSILLLRSEALSDVGGFDERFFLYAEETDWEKRATNLGWKVRFCPRARGSHVGGGTSSDSEVREQHFHASLLEYIEKHHGRRGRSIFRLSSLMGSALRGILGSASARRRFGIYRRDGASSRGRK